MTKKEIHIKGARVNIEEYRSEDTRDKLIVIRCIGFM